MDLSMTVLVGEKEWMASGAVMVTEGCKEQGVGFVEGAVAVAVEHWDLGVEVAGKEQLVIVEGLVAWVDEVEVDVLAAAGDIAASVAIQMVPVSFLMGCDPSLLKAAILQALNEPRQSPACLAGPVHRFAPLLEHFPIVSAFHPCSHSYYQKKPSSHLQSFQVYMFCSLAATISNSYLPEHAREYQYTS